MKGPTEMSTADWIKLIVKSLIIGLVVKIAFLSKGS